jgi:hypothetical protein
MAAFKDMQTPQPAVGACEALIERFLNTGSAGVLLPPRPACAPVPGAYRGALK